MYRRRNDILYEDLQRLAEDYFALSHIPEELETLELEYTALKATSYDKQPGGSGGNSQRDKVEMNIYKREILKQDLVVTQRHVADMERLLGQLTPSERDLIDKLVIRHSRTTEQYAEEIGIQSRQVLNRKANALEKLKRLRFGQGYQP